jgi:hypothetical protein
MFPSIHGIKRGLAGKMAGMVLELDVPLGAEVGYAVTWL